MSELTKLTIAELKRKVGRKEITPQEVSSAYFAEIAKHNPKLNAYILVSEEKAKEQQKDLKTDSLLAGAPIGVKDNYCTKDIITGCCSRMLENFVPTYESTVTENLFANGAVMLGKCNMDEFAMGSTNETSYKGRVISPLRKKSDEEELVPGGSSGGSAAAVAAGMAIAAIGSDTGGSIRQPSAFCGLVGLKPSYGRCSRWGLVAFASSLDQAGPITKNVEDAALMLEAMAGFDPKDSTSVNIKVPSYSANITAGDLKNVRIGIPKEYRSDFLNSEIKAVWEKTAKICEELGATVEDISLPHTQYAAPTYYILNTAEASSNLARFDGVRYGYRSYKDGDSLDEMYARTRGEGFGAEVKKRIALGTYVLSSGYYDAYYKKAQQVRRLISEDFKKAFEKVDLILTPTTPKFAYGDKTTFTNIETYLNDAFTVSANLAGIPALSLPAGLTTESLPIGMQLMSAAFSEDKLLQHAYRLEQALGFSRDNLILRI